MHTNTVEELKIKVKALVLPSNQKEEGYGETEENGWNFILILLFEKICDEQPFEGKLRTLE